MKDVKMANNIIMLAGLGATYFNPPLGLLIINTSGAANIGLGGAEGVLTKSLWEPFKAIAEFTAGTLLAKQVITYGGFHEVDFCWKATRYRSNELGTAGQFIKTQIGQASYKAEAAAEGIVGASFLTYEAVREQ